MEGTSVKESRANSTRELVEYVTMPTCKTRQSVIGWDGVEVGEGEEGGRGELEGQLLESIY